MNRTIEHFNSVPYNSFVVPKNNIRTLYEEDTILLNDTFDLYINKGTTIPDYKNTFIIYPYYMTHPYNNIIKEILLTKLSEYLLKTENFIGTKFEILGDLLNIYWKDIDSSRHFVFNINLNNKKKAFTRKLLVYFIINNINDYLTDTGEYIPLDFLKNFNYTIKYVEVDKELEYTNVEPSKELLYENDNYNGMFQINNTLYLMHPYITSKREMDITDKQKLLFAKKLENPSGFVFKDTNKGSCYGGKKTSLNKDECIKNDGIWDTIPNDEYQCPFYNANQNYPNNFGKLNGELCELPRNMQLVGNRNYSKDPLYKPLCYNCIDNKIDQGSLGFCCDDQNDKKKYPNLITPDYAFINDFKLRNKYKDLLLTKKLNIE